MRTSWPLNANRAETLVWLEKCVVIALWTRSLSFFYSVLRSLCNQPYMHLDASAPFHTCCRYLIYFGSAFASDEIDLYCIEKAAMAPPTPAAAYIILQHDGAQMTNMGALLVIHQLGTQQGQRLEESKRKRAGRKKKDTRPARESVDLPPRRPIFQVR